MAEPVGANPLLEGLQLRRRPEPCILVIFGASGDLTRRKLMPAPAVAEQLPDYALLALRAAGQNFAQLLGR